MGDEREKWIEEKIRLKFASSLQIMECMHTLIIELWLHRISGVSIEIENM